MNEIKTLIQQTAQAGFNYGSADENNDAEQESALNSVANQAFDWFDKNITNAFDNMAAYSMLDHLIEVNLALGVISTREIEGKEETLKMLTDDAAGTIETLNSLLKIS